MGAPLPVKNEEDFKVSKTESVLVASVRALRGLFEGLAGALCGPGAPHAFSMTKKNEEAFKISKTESVLVGSARALRGLCAGRGSK